MNTKASLSLVRGCVCVLLVASLGTVAVGAPSLPITKPPVGPAPGSPGPRWTGPFVDPWSASGQWFLDKDGVEDYRTHEFYDNVHDDAYWEGGGWASWSAIYGKVTSITYDALAINIVAFDIEATITNDTPALSNWEDGTNSHGEGLSTPNQYRGTLYDTKLTGEFAIADMSTLPASFIGPYRNTDPYIIAENEDQLAWYCYSPNNPDADQVPWGGYYVPTWDFGGIPEGASGTRILRFSVSGAGLAPLDPRHGVIVESKETGADVLLNRTMSLKISTWIDDLSFDDGTPYPGPLSLRSSDVSVFHNAQGGPCYTLTLTVVKPNYGHIDVVPNYPCYTPGTAVTLTAFPNANKKFKKYRIWDPNFPGDNNYAFDDTNLVINLTMDNDYVVKAWFKCGGGPTGPLPLLVLTCGILGVAAHRRRRAR